MSFLTQFKRFMLMNQNAAIACDPCAKAAFFLSLIGGPKVEGWIQRTYDWLNDVEADPSLLSFKMNAWQALEAKFKKAFIDYTVHERAQDELRKLKMKEGNVDKYIAAFQLLGHRVGVNLNDPSVLCLFAQGLPKSLAKSCIDIELPKNFKQWTSAAQRQQRNWLRKQALRSNYALPHPQQQSSNRGGFFWCCRNQGNTQGHAYNHVIQMQWTHQQLHTRQ
jgi:Retrotransposon gag protein